VTKVAQTEAELAAHALDAMGYEATTEHDQFAAFGVPAGSPRAPNLVAVFGGGLGLVVLVVLVFSVLNVSHESQHPAVEVKAPSTSAAPTRSVTAAPAPSPAPSIVAPAPPIVASAPSDLPTDAASSPAGPSAQMMAPRSPMTAETMRPPPPPAPMFPRMHELFPRLFPRG
jgi:hypothetical protein